jgi:hypothetical protein
MTSGRPMLARARWHAVTVHERDQGMHLGTAGVSSPMAESPKNLRRNHLRTKAYALLH